MAWPPRKLKICVDEGWSTEGAAETVGKQDTDGGQRERSGWPPTVAMHSHCNALQKYTMFGCNLHAALHPPLLQCTAATTLSIIVSFFFFF